jgi:ankyrin repeat protein
MLHPQMPPNRLLSNFVFLLPFIAASFSAYASDASLPECAHWTNAFVFTEFMPHAKVVGTQGQRLFMFRQNPQVCDHNKLESCDTNRYVLTGDRVTIGHTCGKWAHVQFQSRRKASVGWVEYARLKSVPPEKASLEARSKWKPHVANEPLAKAVQSGDISIVKLLLKSKEDINNALDLSVQYRKPRLVAELLELGAQPEETAAPCKLMIDAIQGSPDIIALILNSGGQINFNFHVQCISTLKAFAMTSRAARPAWAAMGHFRDPGIDDLAMFFKLFLQHDANLNIKDVWNGTPLRATLENNNVDIAILLLDAGADVNNYIDDSTSIGEQHGNTILMEAIFWYSLRWDASLIKVLLQHGADVNFRNGLTYDEECDKTTSGKCTFRGQTALTRAAGDGLYAVVKLLLEHGATPTLPRSDGATPSTIALNNGHTEIAKLIDSYTAK